MSSLNPLDWMRHRIDVWETMRLDLELDDEGFLARLYDLMHRDGGPIPADPIWLARACRVSTRIVKKLVPRLLSAGFITAENGGKCLWSAYVEAELENSAERSNKARKGADARWGRDRNASAKSSEKRAESAHDPAEPRESRANDRNEKREKHNKNNESAMLQKQCYGEEDIDVEGVAPTVPTPDDQPSLHQPLSSTSSDARGSASGLHSVCRFKVGDVVKVPHGEAMRVDEIGFDGSEWFLKLKEDSVFDMDAMIVPLDRAGNPRFEGSWWNDGNEAKTDRIDWNPVINNPAPKSRRQRNAAA